MIDDVHFHYKPGRLNDSELDILTSVSSLTKINKRMMDKHKSQLGTISFGRNKSATVQSSRFAMERSVVYHWKIVAGTT
ncbi:hypothetical protein OROGR_003901 [Orobanche gracilis]